MNITPDKKPIDALFAATRLNRYRILVTWNSYGLMATFNTGAILLALELEAGLYFIFSGIPFMTLYCLDLCKGRALSNWYATRASTPDKANLNHGNTHHHLVMSKRREASRQRKNSRAYRQG